MSERDYRPDEPLSFAFSFLQLSMPFQQANQSTSPILLFQQMSTISHIRRLNPSFKSPLRPLLPPTRHRNLHTEHSPSPPSSNRNEQTVCRNILFPLMQKSKEFPSIFVQHRRNDYSGYKHASKPKAQPEERPMPIAPRHINSQNIAKLRKRYSLEPLILMQCTRQHQRMFLSTSKSVRGEEGGSSERNYHRELREMIRMMNLHKHSASEKMFTNGEKIASYSTGTSQNLSQCLRNSSDEEISAEPPRRSACNKPYYVQFKKRVERKLQSKRRVEPLKSTANTIEEENDVCGWSTQSFYPKHRPSLPQESPSPSLHSPHIKI